MEKKPEFIAKGSYGCIYTPSIPCLKEEKSNELWVSKIQAKSKSLEQELEINNILKKDKESVFYFILIDNVCKIKKKEKYEKTCDLISKKKDCEFVNLQMKYIKGKNLIKALIQETRDENVNYTKQKYKNMLKLLIENMLHLLEGVDILQKNNVIHSDLHENNILVDEESKITYIIDFGLSMVNTKEEIIKKLKRYTTTPTIDFWCIDIQILLHLVNIENKEIKKEELIENIKLIVKMCISSNKVFQCFTETFRKMYEENVIKIYTDYILESYHFSGEKNIINELIEKVITYTNTWDTYTISIIIMDMIERIFTSEINKFTNEKVYSFPKHPFVEKLTKILLQNIHPDQSKRYTSKETQNKVKELLSLEKDELIFV